MFYEGRCWHLAFCFTKKNLQKKHQTAQVILHPVLHADPATYTPHPRKTPAKPALQPVLPQQRHC